ncbi:hypothetical protein CASFOL_009921 [Castilleja foliolosa]|uniref:B box-type domain-containing protein n=1 Tax=Castilleja foliolosa TaxID=1961234 RepID=A0ABD3DV78_9LAMI
MGGCNFRLKKRKTASDWVSGLLRSKFFGSCSEHGELKKNEMNLFCLDCNLCLCKHCVTSSSHDDDRLLQICKYVYRDVVRLHDIEQHLDCSLIQAYKINGEKAVHLNPRPQLKDPKNSKAKIGGTCCEACGRHIQDLPNRFCSIACKVSIIDITINQKIISTEYRQLPELEQEESSYQENGYASSSISLTESSSEVIQAWLSSALRPNKRKSLPIRAPMC